MGSDIEGIFPTGSMSFTISPEEPKFSNDHNVEIRKIDNGFLVEVGCKKLAVLTLKELLSDLKDYYEKPEKVYKKYGIEE